MTKFILSFLLFVSTSMAWGKVVHYELTARKQKVNITGQDVDFALTVNGGIPAPLLEFTEGDDAEIVVKNEIPDDELSIHWHGILLPPLMDGVPYVTTPPILPGQQFVFKFKVRQNGTYWYHSHTNVQEQKGVYGPIDIHPQKETIHADKEVVAVLSDWTDENPSQVLNNLKKDGDYYLPKKGTIRSYAGALKAGGLKTQLQNEWTRMGGMDLSDVGYDAFLINGKKDSQLIVAHPGEKVRVRIINASGSTYFHVSLGQAPMKVISADGRDIEPVLAKDILIGMAETYDVLFEVPEHKNFELKATAQDGTGSASAWIGMGEKVPAPVRPAPDLYASMDHSAHGGAHSDHGSHAGHTQPTTTDEDHSGMNHEMMTMDHSAHAGHEGHSAQASGEPAKPLRSVESLTVDELKAQDSTPFPANAPVHDLKLVLGGDMRRYIWHINGKAMFEDRNVVIKAGDVVRFTFKNQSMMHHPMHLHGHFFRVKNQFGEFSPWKHTVDVPPHSTRTIEFLADEPGEWMLHCHNLYHMKTGMARVVKYMSFTPAPDIAALQPYDHHMHDHWYQAGLIEGVTNHAQGKLRFQQTWNEVDARVEARKDDKWEPEGDLFFRRWFDNYLNVIVGGSVVDKDARGELGVGYLLPMLIETNVMVDHKGKLRVDLEKRFQWTQKIFTDVDYTWRQDEDLGSESEISLMYAPNWAWSAGVKYTGHSFGVGFQYRF